MVTLDGAHAASATVMVQTQAGVLPGTPSPQGRRDLSYRVLLRLLSLATIGVLMKARQRRLRLVSVVAVMASMIFVGCNGANSGAGTPKGTYHLVISGVSGGQSHSVKILLNVR